MQDTDFLAFQRCCRGDRDGSADGANTLAILLAQGAPAHARQPEELVWRPHFLKRVSGYTAV